MIRRPPRSTLIARRQRQMCIRDSNDKHFAINMATKVFSYIEAGLPVIVHTEAPYIREFTADNGQGLVYELDRMDLIPDLVASCDHEALRAALRTWRSKNDNSGAVAPLEAAFAA